MNNVQWVVVGILAIVLILSLLTILEYKTEWNKEVRFSIDKCEFVDPDNPENSFYIEHFCSLKHCSRCSNAEKQDPNATLLPWMREKKLIDRVI